jgi:hypothetical protein
MKTSRSQGAGIGSSRAIASMSVFDIVIWIWPCCRGNWRQPFKVADMVNHRCQAVDRLRSEPRCTQCQIPHTAIPQCLQKVELCVDPRVEVAINQVRRWHPKKFCDCTQMLHCRVGLDSVSQLPQVSGADRHASLVGDRLCRSRVGQRRIRRLTHDLEELVELYRQFGVVRRTVGYAIGLNCLAQDTFVSHGAVRYVLMLLQTDEANPPDVYVSACCDSVRIPI